MASSTCENRVWHWRDCGHVALIEAECLETPDCLFCEDYREAFELAGAAAVRERLADRSDQPSE